MSEYIPVQVEISTDELREWAGRHADAGHHGVAHVLYKAAEGIESITEQHDADIAAKALRDAADDSQRGPVAYGWNASGIASWLKDRAEQIEKGAGE